MKGARGVMGTEDVVLCPSVFGVYPKAPLGTCAVDLSGGIKAISCEVIKRTWESVRFVVQMRLHAGCDSASVSFSGGAKTLRSLSQGLLSQCMNADLPAAIGDLVAPESLADFLFDQLVSESMEGAVRQAEGVMGAPWLSVADLQEVSLVVGTPSLMLGEVTRHPAAYMAALWRSASPLRGADGRVPARFAGILAQAEPHFRAGGCLVAGPSVIKDRVPGKRAKVALPPRGWVVTGNRGGVEALARSQARRLGHPLLVVSRQDEVASLLVPSLFQCVIADTKTKPLGSFRQKMVDKLQKRKKNRYQRAPNRR